MNATLAFTENLASLLNTGTTLNKALALIGDHHPDQQFKGVVADLRKDVEQGYSLSESLANQQPVFSDFFIGVVRSGERSAELPRALRQLAEQLQREHDLKQKIKSALVYPTILIVGMFLSLLVIFSVVLPQFSNLFDQYGGTLPWLTRALLGISEAVRLLAPWLLAVVIAVAIWLYKPQNRQRMNDRFFSLMLRFTSVRELLNQLDFARLCYSLSSLLQAGLAQSEALKLARESLSLKSNRQQIDALVIDLEAGSSLSECLPSLDGLNPLYAHSLANAESANALPKALIEYGQRLEDDFNARCLRLAQLVEPALIIVLGAIIGLIVYTLFSSLQGVSGSIT